MEKKLRILAVVVLVAVTVTACGSRAVEDDTASEAVAAVYLNPAVSGGKIAVDTSLLTEHPVYINYDSDGTTVQMLAVMASDGTGRLSLNTCQSCNPSPRAFFREKDGMLVCQNCGNTFTMDSIGSSSGGCNPMNIDYEDTGDQLIIEAETLDGFSEQFVSWSGPTK